MTAGTPEQPAEAAPEVAGGAETGRDAEPPRAAGPHRRITRAAVPALLILETLAVATAVGIAGPVVWRSRWVQDDAYISFRYARNMIEGHGLVYNAGEWVEGYTNFLWTMISAVPLAFGADDPLPAMHLLGMGLWLGTYGLLVLLGLALARRGVLIGPLIALPPLAVWSYNQWFMSGMETGLVSFLTALLLLLMTLQDLERPGRAAGLGLAVTALLLTRPDTAFFIAGAAVAGMLCQWRWFAHRRFWGSWLPALVLPVIVVYLPYTGWRLGYYDGFFPNTYYAKMADLPAFDRGRDYLEAFLRVYELGPFLLLPLVAIPLARAEAVRRFLAGATLGSAATALYVWRLGGDFMEWRFVMPATGVFATAVGVAAYVIGHRIAAPMKPTPTSREATPPATAAAIVATIGALGVMTWLGLAAAGGRDRSLHILAPGQEHIPSLAKYAGPDYAWDEVGRACDAVLPDDLRIATTAAGMLPYFARRPTLDLHGLTSRAIARSPLNPGEVRGRLGHERVLKNRVVMRKLGAGAFVHTEPLSMVPLALAAADHPHEVTVSVRVDERRYFDVDLFDPPPALLAELRRRDDVVFSDPSRLLPKEEMVLNSELTQSHRLIARLDVQLPASERAHEFAEFRVGEGGLNRVTHEKLLGYDLTDEILPLRDEGRRIFGRAVWVIDGVSVGRDLVMVIRHDRSSCSRYWVRVNGRRSTQLLTFECGRESWAELRYDIPREMLADGRITIALDPEQPGHTVAEIYHLWFLQMPGPDDPG